MRTTQAQLELHWIFRMIWILNCTNYTTTVKNFKDSNFGPSLNANYTGAIGTTLDFPNDLDLELYQLHNYRPKILKTKILGLH